MANHVGTCPQNAVRNCINGVFPTAISCPVSQQIRAGEYVA